MICNLFYFKVSGLRSTTVEFEGAKHEIRHLTEELELANSQVEELTNLKKIAEKQLEEALESLQVTRFYSSFNPILHFRAKSYDLHEPKSSIYLLCLGGLCLLSCLYPINVKTAEPIESKIFKASHIIPGKVYGWSEVDKFCLKHFHQSFFIKLRLKIATCRVQS